MSFLDRISEANDGVTDGLVPFVVGGRRVGWLVAERADRLAEWSTVFERSEETLRLRPSLDAEGVPPEVRTQAVAPVVAALRSSGELEGWRDELFPVKRRFDDPAALLIERAAIPLFGVRGYGVHVNGLVREGGRVSMWVARRAADKPTWPDLLDQLVAGGQPAGLSVGENLLKECAEEAGIGADLVASASAAGTVSYCMRTPAGVRPDLVFVYDLTLPRSFRPLNQDGEVESFELLPVEEVAEIVSAGPAFKPNCSLVVIDFLVRHGYLSPDAPDYEAVAGGLRVGY